METAFIDEGAMFAIVFHENELTDTAPTFSVPITGTSGAVRHWSTGDGGFFGRFDIMVTTPTILCN